MPTLANAENDALVSPLADRLAEVEVETLGEGQAKKEAYAQVGRLAEKVTEWQVHTFGNLLSVVDANAQPRH